jgi:uracil-DNA glycosylase
MTPEARHAAFRELAATLDRIDLPVYEQFGIDPHEPTLGAGDADCRICFFGRDPGRNEVKHRQPFVGAGGQKIRRVLHQLVHGAPLPDFEASLEVGRYTFWANTVPYKPVGNKVWPAKVRKAFRPLVQDLLLRDWNGEHVLALGREAFFWFAADRAERKRFTEHWEREDRFETSIAVDVVSGDDRRTLKVHPLPHPSPLNAVWHARFEPLLHERLVALGFGADSWRL